MTGLTNDGAVVVTRRPAAGVPSGAPVSAGIARTNDGAAYVTGLGDGQVISHRALLFGDSIMEAENKNLTVASLSQAGGVITIAISGLGLGPGHRIRILDSAIDALNVEHSVATAVSANEITITSAIADLPATISPASGKTVIRVIDLMRQRDRGIIGWGNALAGAPLDIVMNLGWAGATSFDLQDDVSLIAGYSPGVVFYMAGINDMTTGSGATYTAADCHANDVIVHAACKAIGAQFWLFTLCPLSSTHASYSTAITQKILELNKLRRDYARTNPDVVLVDAFKVCVDPSSTTANYRSGYDHDALHPSAEGAYRIGKEVARLLTLKVPTVDIFPTSQADDYGTNSANPNLIDNGLFYGTAGSKSGSPAPTGDVADGWTVTNSGLTVVTCSLVAAQSGIGQAQRIVTTADGDGDYVQLALSASIHARVSEGDVIQVGADIACSSATAMKYIRMLVAMAANGITITPEAMQTVGTGYPATLSETTIRVLSPKIRIPASLTSLNVQIRAGNTGVGGCTFDVSRAFIRKVSAD